MLRRAFLLFAIIGALACLAVSAVSEDDVPGFMLPEAFRADPSEAPMLSIDGPSRLPTEAEQHKRARGSGRMTRKKVFLKVHNQVRKKYDARKLKWDNKLERYAKKWAKGCKFEHSHGKYGENLWASVGHRKAGEAVRSWASEAKNYDSKKPGFAMNTGHFTQVVWASTRKVGCATAKCTPEQLGFGSGYSGVAEIVVCSYWPPGNYQGAFEQNVKV